MFRHLSGLLPSSLRRLSFIAFLAAMASASAVCQNQAKPASAPQIILGNPSRGQINTQPLNAAGYAYGTIQGAINAGMHYIYLPCGTYVENVVIATSDIRIEGAELGCVQLQPANPALPVISIDATNAGQTGIGFDEVSNLTITCPSGETCDDGLKIVGRTDIWQPNDWHRFVRLDINGAFENGIDVAGRTIWTEFENIYIASARGNGISIASAGTTNHTSFRNVRAADSWNYGIYINNTQIDLINGLEFDQTDVEYNGNNPSLTNCAGMYLTGVSQVNIVNSYFEANCAPNKADQKLAEIRLTGTYNQSVNIRNCVFNLQYRENGIYNDSLQTTGMYDGNKFTGSGENGMTIYIATHHYMSNIVVGANFSSTPTIVPDNTGHTHVRTLAPFGFDYSAVTSVTNNTLTVGGSNGLYLYYGPYTISNIVNGTIGQIISVTALTTSGHVLKNGAGGTGQILFPNGMDQILNAGETLLLMFDGTNWRPVESTITSTAAPSNAMKFVGTITTSTNSSDTLSGSNLTSQSHCSYVATNFVASQMSSVFVGVSADTVTLYHSQVSGGTFDIFCTSN